MTRDSFQEELERLQKAKARETPETEDIDEKKEDTTLIDLSTRVEPPAVRQVQSAGIDIIEVDDNNSDAESVHIDVSAICHPTNEGKGIIC